MDLLSQRYANPCFFMDGMIQTGRFDEFVNDFVKTHNQEREEKTEWEFFLHKVWEGSFGEFKQGLENDKKHQNMSKADIETAIKQTEDIVNEFNSRSKGGE